MKRLSLALSLAILSFFAHAQDYSNLWDEHVPALSPDAAFAYIVDNVPYNENKEIGPGPWIQNPQYTYLFGGVCADQAVLFMDMVRKAGFESFYVSGYLRSWDKRSHAIVRVGSNYYDPTNNKKWNHNPMSKTLAVSSFYEIITAPIGGLPPMIEPKDLLPWNYAAGE